MQSIGPLSSGNGSGVADNNSMTSNSNIGSSSNNNAAAAATSGVASFFSRLLQRVEGCSVSIEFDDECAGRQQGDRHDATHALQQQPQQPPPPLVCFTRDAAVCGAVVLTPSSASFAHRGVVIALTGVVRTRNESGGEAAAVTFVQQEQRYEAATLLQQQQPTRYAFDFAATKAYESYAGVRVEVEYSIHATVMRPVKNLTASRVLWVTCVDEALSRAEGSHAARSNNSNNSAAATASCAVTPPVRGMARDLVYGPQSTSMEVGVEDTLHIEFRFSKSVFDLCECVYGVIVFKIATLDITAGEVSLLRKEYVGADAAANRISESEVLYKMDVMDGAPIVGEVLPVRLFLRAVPRLTPTYIVSTCTPQQHSNSSSNSGSSSSAAIAASPSQLCRYSVRYFVSIVLIGSNGRRYFKQQELTLYRKHGQEHVTSVATRPLLA